MGCAGVHRRQACDLNPIVGSRWLNRRGLHIWRSRLAHRLAEGCRRTLARGPDAAWLEQFSQDGVVVAPAFLPPELYARVAGEVASFRGEALAARKADAITRTFVLTARTLRRLPACRTLVVSPRWTRLLHYVASFDAAPILYLQPVFSRTGPGKRDPQTAVHMGAVHPTMKGWPFLQDGTQELQPFSYVPGPHLSTARRDAWERDMSVQASDPATPSRGGSYRIDGAALRRIHLPQPRATTVRANTLVVADTCGFQARSPNTQPFTRVAIYAARRRNPSQPCARLNLRAPAFLELAF